MENQSCLEIGCGAGRITMQLAKYFQNTCAVMFLVSDGISLPNEDDSCTAVFSSHVFQHFDTLEHVSQYFAEISRVLKPGGSMMIHLPVFQWHPDTPRIFMKLIQTRKYIANAAMYFRRRLIQHGPAKPMMQNMVYPIKFFYNVLPVYGFMNIEISIFSVKSNGGIHPFVFARKGQLLK